jgi:hypothetical protein
MFFTPSLECITRLREMTDIPIVRSVLGAPDMDMTELIKQAEGAGANGVNLACDSAGGSRDGNAARK